MKKNSLARGFTLIEMMIVIVIIALLTGIIVTNLTSAKSKSRDAKRISDLGTIQLALELYYDRCKQYPSAIADPNSQSCTIPGTGTVVPLSTYIANIPLSPGGTAYDYVTSGTPPTDYILHTTLENANELVRDGIQNSQKGSSYSSIQCYDSSHLMDYCLGPK